MTDPVDRQETTLTPSKKDPFEDNSVDVPQTPEVIL